jgi:predicted HicB family RNase H-like nuclease
MTKAKSFMLRKMSPELHKAIRIEAAIRETSMEEVIYELLSERLLEKKEGEDDGTY